MNVRHNKTVRILANAGRTQILVISFLLLIGSKGFSQNYMDVIVKKSCECLDNIPDTLETQQFNMKLGVCMIEASTPHKAKIKKDYDIDLDKIETDGQKLGRMIGVKMAGVCPNSLLKITQRAKTEKPPVKQQTMVGMLTKIENDFFVAFSVKDDLGKITKYYWLTFVESEIDLLNTYTTLVGKSVSIDYEPQDFFDPRLLEYRRFFIIKKIELVK